MIAVGNDAQYRRLCAVLGRPDLAERPALPDDAAARRAARDSWCRRSRRSCAAADRRTGCPCCARPRCRPGRSTTSRRSSRTRRSGIANCCAGAHTLAGTLPVIGNPLKFSATPVRLPRAAAAARASTRPRCCARCSRWTTRRSNDRGRGRDRPGGCRMRAVLCRAYGPPSVLRRGGRAFARPGAGTGRRRHARLRRQFPGHADHPGQATSSSPTCRSRRAARSRA